MRRVLRGIAIVLGIVVILVLGHLAVIEVGREVVVLRTERADGTVWASRLWIVDDDGSVWLHSAGDDWVKRFEGDPIVEVERRGKILRYQAHAVPGPHPRVDQLLREKYGVADCWVRTLAPDNDSVVAVRLDPVDNS